MVPVIFVGILNFSLFKTTEYSSHHLILDNETYEHELKHLEFHFIELDKFTKNIDELVTILDKWIYFLKNADSLRLIPDTFKQNALLNEAFVLVEQGNWSKKELNEYDAYIDSLRSAESILDTARTEAKFEGKREGKLEGEFQKSVEIAKKLLDAGISQEIITATTRLDNNQINALK